VSDERALVQTAVQIVLDPILDLLQRDPHQWSSRPCQTCRTITSLLGKPFGCYRYQAEKTSNGEPR